MKLIDWRKFNLKFVAGTDEVGRGCLAGPVYAAAVILRPENKFRTLTDSKLLSAEARHTLAQKIREKALCWAIGSASVEEIDELNILQASLLAMRRAVEGLSQFPELVLIDGIHKVGGVWEQKTFVKGDLRLQPISAASVLAKVTRDGHMTELDEKYPGYGLAKHKGYATLQHRKAIEKIGPSLIHRKSFACVKEYLPPK